MLILYENNEYYNMISFLNIIIYTSIIISYKFIINYCCRLILPKLLYNLFYIFNCLLLF